MRCGFDPDSGRRICTGLGSMLACQLCPDSPTYWQNTPAGAPPVTRAAETTPKADDAPPPVVLDWTSKGPHGAAPVCKPPRPCILCRLPAHTLSPDKLKPCHKVCAERWLTEHPNARRAHRGPETLTA